MTQDYNESSLQKIARLAGIMFLLLPIGGILYGAFIMFKLTDPGNVITTTKNILANTTLFRIGILYEVSISVVAIILGSALYKMLKPVNKQLAFTALLFKLAEAIIVTVMALLSFIALQILMGDTSGTLLASKQLQVIFGAFFNAHMLLYAIPMVFLGISFPLFFHVLKKSGYVPKKLACFGIVSYILILLFSLLSILTPQCLQKMPQVLFWGPSVIFELVIGVWLVIKGIKVQK